MTRLLVDGQGSGFISLHPRRNFVTRLEQVLKFENVTPWRARSYEKASRRWLYLFVYLLNSSLSTKHHLRRRLDVYREQLPFIR
jgi:hypothetical protein